MPRDDPPAKQRHNITADPRVWALFAAICQTRGERVSTRIASTLIPADIRNLGTPEQVAELEAAIADQPRTGPAPSRTKTDRPAAPARELREWAALRDEGVITEAEFQTKKARLLRG